MVSTAKSVTGAANSLLPLHNRPPPAAPDAEAAVLSAVIIDESSVRLDEVRAILADGEAFFDTRNRVIYRAICALADAGEPHDIVTIGRRLNEDGKLNAAGGAPYIALVIDATPAVSNVRAHAEIVRDCWRMRQTLALSQMTVAEIYSQETGEVQPFLEALEERISDLARPSTTRELRPLGDLIGEARDFILAAQDGVKGVSGVATGFTQVDKRTAGYQRGDLIYIAGRPGQGKTAYALAVARSIAAGGDAVAFFSLEMPGYQVALRLIAAEARIDLLKMRSGMLNKSDLSAIMLAIQGLARLPIFIDDSPAITVFDVRARAKRLDKEIAVGKVGARSLALIAIDYVQLMTPPHVERANREQAVAALSRELKQLAKQLKAPVAALSQLNRDVERRGGDKRPQLSDLRESGQLEADADLIQFLYRAEYYNPNDPEVRGVAEVITAKQRNGPTGIDLLAFRDSCTRFDNLEGGAVPDQQLPLPDPGYDPYEDGDD